MERVLERTPEGTSPRTFALNHLRPKSSFQGCSRISEYELLGKLGEGTFGYVVPHEQDPGTKADFRGEQRGFGASLAGAGHPDVNVG